MPKQRKPRRLWALKRPNGSIDLGTVARTRKDAICSFGTYGIWSWDYKEEWASHKKQGWRCVKVEVTEVHDG